MASLLLAPRAVLQPATQGETTFASRRVHRFRIMGNPENIHGHFNLSPSLLWCIGCIAQDAHFWRGGRAVECTGLEKPFSGVFISLQFVLTQGLARVMTVYDKAGGGHVMRVFAVFLACIDMKKPMQRDQVSVYFSLSLYCLKHQIVNLSTIEPHSILP